MGWATALIAQLKEGTTVQFRPRGNSMTPKIRSGQLCTVVPIENREVAKGDIVLCKIGKSQYLHLVSAVTQGRYQISNNHGHVNGTIGLDSIFGVLTKVE